MNHTVSPLFDSETFPTNCRVHLTGKHFFADRIFYTNLYGLSFYSSPEEYGDNPYISSSCARAPGLLESFLEGESYAHPDFYPPVGDLQARIRSQIHPKFQKRPAGKRRDMYSLSCLYEGNLSRQGDSLILQYGTGLPCVFCITGENAVTARLPFSPFPELSFEKEKRVMQTLYYPVPREEGQAPEELAVDFSVTTKQFSNTLREGKPGALTVEYVLDIGAARCESSRFCLEVEPLSSAEVPS